MFQQQNINYSLKNIPTPSRKQYMKGLIEKTENFLKRLRWKAWLFLNKNTDDDDSEEELDTKIDFYGFRTSKLPPHVHELQDFEKELYHLISNIEFSTINSDFQKQIKKDIKAMKSKKKVIIESDKTRNLYALEAEDYNKLLTENVTKEYKKINLDKITEINKQSKHIAEKKHLDDRMEVIQKKESFITLKDHKDNFETNPKCRLINPSKTDMGKIAKQTLESYVKDLRMRTLVNQWGNTTGVTK